MPQMLKKVRAFILGQSSRGTGDSLSPHSAQQIADAKQANSSAYREEVDVPNLVHELGLAEDWCISECSGDTVEFQLQKLDDAEVFKEDADAWLRVMRQAHEEGSETHKEALDFLRINSPGEYKKIVDHYEAFPKLATLSL